MNNRMTGRFDHIMIRVQSRRHNAILNTISQLLKRVRLFSAFAVIGGLSAFFGQNIRIPHIFKPLTHPAVLSHCLDEDSFSVPAKLVFKSFAVSEWLSDVFHQVGENHDREFHIFR